LKISEAQERHRLLVVECGNQSELALVAQQHVLTLERQLEEAITTNQQLSIDYCSKAAQLIALENKVPTLIDESTRERESLLKKIQEAEDAEKQLRLVYGINARRLVDVKKSHMKNVKQNAEELARLEGDNKGVEITSGEGMLHSNATTLDESRGVSSHPFMLSPADTQEESASVRKERKLSTEQSRLLQEARAAQAKLEQESDLILANQQKLDQVFSSSLVDIVQEISDLKRAIKVQDELLTLLTAENMGIYAARVVSFQEELETSRKNYQEEIESLNAEMKRTTRVIEHLVQIAQQVRDDRIYVRAESSCLLLLAFLFHLTMRISNYTIPPHLGAPPPLPSRYKLSTLSPCRYRSPFYSGTRRESI